MDQVIKDTQTKISSMRAELKARLLKEDPDDDTSLTFAIIFSFFPPAFFWLLWRSRRSLISKTIWTVIYLLISSFIIFATRSNG